MRINTLTKKLSMDECYSIVMHVVEWGKNNLEPPKVKRKNKFCVMIHKSDKEVYGEYCEKHNWLTINLQHCITVKDIVSTTIHEYTHYLQDLKNYAKKDRRFGYDDNPYEVQARETENAYTLECWRDIRKKILAS